MTNLPPKVQRRRDELVKYYAPNKEEKQALLRMSEWMYTEYVEPLREVLGYFANPVHLEEGIEFTFQANIEAEIEARVEIARTTLEKLGLDDKNPEGNNESNT